MLAVHLRRSVSATVYLTGGMLVATVVAIVLPTGLGLGIGLIPLFLLGLPILAGTMMLWRWLAVLERDRAALVLGAPIAAPA
ncbi:MAG TPA: sensor domain-containing protein, partial [Solirubrobacteraceae bacterium]|nr:sensor domain-containing protein [Solirubrobacteraceae bacterium]